MPKENATIRIRELNDQFRRSLIGGRVVMTAGVSALGPHHIAHLMRAVRAFTAFDEANDPHGEHDFGALEHAGERYFFKIDYYDLTLTYGSEDPSDASKTTRVLSVLRADEY